MAILSGLSSEKPRLHLPAVPVSRSKLSRRPCGDMVASRIRFALPHRDADMGELESDFQSFIKYYANLDS
jgi:hypothetical protein